MKFFIIFNLLFISLFSVVLNSKVLWKSSIVIGMPVKVVVNKEGIFIGDSKQIKIFHLDLNGKMISEIGKPGEGPNEFTSLQDFAIHKEKIYVKSNSRIKCLNLKGEFINKWNFTMKYTVHHFFVNESGFILVGKKFETDPKAYSKPETSPYNFFHNISFSGELIKSFGPSFPELEKLNVWDNLLILAGMTPSVINNEIFYANHLNYQIWKASIRSGESVKLIDEDVLYFIPFLSKLNQFSGKGGTITRGDIRGTYIRFFKDGEKLVVYLKGGSWSKGYKSTYLRVYALQPHVRFIKETKLDNNLNVFSYYNGVFYGFDDEGDFLAMKIDSN